jgi:hypothetical protein
VRTPRRSDMHFDDIAGLEHVVEHKVVQLARLPLARYRERALCAHDRTAYYLCHPAVDRWTATGFYFPPRLCRSGPMGTARPHCVIAASETPLHTAATVPQGCSRYWLDGAGGRRLRAEGGLGTAKDYHTWVL